MADENGQGAFARLLRFWRTSLGMSQSELSFEVDVSARHISFLETGRSKPGRQMVLRLARVLKLSDHDANNLLVAAGFMPDPTAIDFDSVQFHWLRKSLVLDLRALDPYPACVTDASGRIFMVNRAAVDNFSTMVDLDVLPQPLNLYHLFFSDKGLRPHLVEWDDAARVLLMTAQQEALLSNTPEAHQLVEELLHYPDIPKDWRQKARDLPYMSSFKFKLRFQGEVNSFFMSYKTLASSLYVPRPRLMLISIIQENGLYPRSKRELLEDESLKHPLLRY